MYLFHPLYDRQGLSNRLILAEAFLLGLAGIGAAWVLFPQYAGLVSVFLVGFAAADTLQRLFERNQDDIWRRGDGSYRANERLAFAVLSMFTGLLAAYALVSLAAPVASLDRIFDPQLAPFGGRTAGDLILPGFLTLLGHNALVMIAGFLAALVYREGGILLVLGWNASLWGSAFPVLVRRAAPGEGITAVAELGRLLPGILPHLLLESMAYVLVAMAGVFLSKGLQRYRSGSPELRRVLDASAMTSGLALLTLLAACAWESQVSTWVLSRLYP
ncbi:MAG: stage II sporulation protein M [Pseudomonadota bacterium]